MGAKANTAFGSAPTRSNSSRSTTLKSFLILAGRSARIFSTCFADSSSLVSFRCKKAEAPLVWKVAFQFPLSLESSIKPASTNHTFGEIELWVLTNPWSPVIIKVVLSAIPARSAASIILPIALSIAAMDLYTMGPSLPSLC